MGALTVGLLRTHGGTASEARNRTAAALRDVPEVHEVLVVRRVVLRTDGHGRRAAIAFDEARRAAVRPHTQPVPRDCAAVLFADEAEVLACLTRDAVAHRLDAWYWRRLVRPTSGRASTLADAWLARVRFLPAALATLRPDEAVAAVSLLDAAAARAVRSALLLDFAVRADVPELAGAVEAPWRPWLPAGAVSGPPEREALLGTALALQAAPVLARRAPFSAAAAHWLAAARAARRGEPGPPPPGDRPSTLAAGPTGVPSFTSASPRRVDGHRRVGRSTTASSSAAAPDSVPPPPQRAVRPPATTPDTGLHTALAGAFYLVTAIEWLRLLDLPDRPDEVGGWAAIELLARDLVPDADERDPLWSLLAALDGRDDTDAPPDAAARSWAHEVADVLRDEFARRDVRTDVLATAGVVTATRTHVDVWFPIEAIDLAARRCGLDRDPGWVPDLARIVAFHFVGGAA